MQHCLRAKISLRCRQRRPRLVAGVDVSYRPPNQAIAAYARFDVVTQQLVWSTTIQRTTSFPYIPSYLAFRELPVLIDLLDHVQRHDCMAQMLMVDGSGILHPRSAGLATLLGIVADLPTVGVAKKLLCGRVNLNGMRQMEFRPVNHGGRRVGVALRARTSSKRPLFISPGQLISIDAAARLVRQTMHRRRLPEPIYWADRISRGVAKGVPCKLTPTPEAT